MENHDSQQLQPHYPVLGGKAYVYKRDNTKFWYAATYISGHSYRHSTKEEQLQDAIQFAENWYLSLRGQDTVGALEPPGATKEPGEESFAHWSEIFLKEYATLTVGERSPKWVKCHEINLRVHINPFLGHLPINKVDSSIAQNYRMHRMTVPTEKKPHSKGNYFKAKVPARKTLHNEIVTIRLVMKTAMRHKAITSLPDLSPPFRGQTKVTHRPWFSLSEYKQLYTATRKYAKTALPHVRWSAAQVHDYVLFMANTGLRPDEAMNLEHRDVEIVHDDETDETILHIEVRGKRGVGYCKSTPNAVKPYQRLLTRPKPSHLNEEGEEINPGAAKKQELPQPRDKVFPSHHIKLFNNLLVREKLKYDRDGQPRVAYSLRHSYICFRLMEGADAFNLAKNCRTSVEIIEDHYAKHIKHLLNAGLINTRKSKRSKTITDDADQDL
jgi:integrase